MSEYIPFEIQTEIIKRLPAKSAVKFRLVSKPWNSYVGSSEFIIAHHHRNIHHQPHRLLAWCKDPVDIPDGGYVTVFDDDTFYQQDFTPKAPLLTKILEDSRVIDCCLGLVCLYGHYHNSFSLECILFRSNMAIIWNPLLRKSVQVHVPYYFSCACIAFGVCPVTFDPTIVKISHGNLIDCQPWEVEVFTLSSGTWKSLMSSNLPPKTVYLQSSDQVVIDGFIYWHAHERRIVSEDRPRDVNVIVSFDMTTHKFEVVDLPDTLSHHFYMTLSKIRESIGVVGYTRENMKNVCAVWVMEDIVTKSFTMLYTIKAPNLSSKTILGFRKSEEPIMETHDENKKSATIGVYDPCSEHISKLGIYGEDRSFFVSSYMGTLLLLDQADRYINSGNHLF